MGVLLRSVPKGAVCCFTDAHGGEVPAEVTCVFEFTHHSDRYVCKDHADRIDNALTAWGYWN